MTDPVWDEIFQVNLKGAFYASRAAMPLLRQRNGCIINISSVAGLQGHGSSIPYSASKAAMNCMTQSLARAFAPDVRVNAVAPGPIQTRWLVGREEHIEKAIAQTPMKRASTPEDIAEAVWFLAGWHELDYRASACCGWRAHDVRVAGREQAEDCKYG